MSEYISKESIVTLLEQYGYIDKEMERDLASIPSADVRPNIHARWIELPKAFNPNEIPCKCSNPKCGEILSFMNGYPKSKFCPSCGAIMDGKRQCECCIYHKENGCSRWVCIDAEVEPKDILHKAIDNTPFAEEAYPNIKEKLHKAVDMAEPKGEKGTT